MIAVLRYQCPGWTAKHSPGEPNILVTNGSEQCLLAISEDNKPRSLPGHLLTSLAGGPTGTPHSVTFC
ncbi:hypothetical protein L873DRAFT_1815043 [Choiromyces venosus 120613-1]|uniref:Uncharacterized protein n=1 Tax=Choiromyces venosus 120613-1 TaxID=1336337 RepID=A0A3N4JAT1_9PEZI|nr:hypothetical protein L873DRAFT_1815043 [Choiromyces venosus 120613-1]